MKTDIPAIAVRNALDEIERRTGSLLLPPEAYGYEDARLIFNRMLDRRPAAIVRPRSVSDIHGVVHVLSKYGLNFTVRAGGHSIAGTCAQDGAVMLDLSLLRRVEVDSSTGLATVEPGALWSDFDRAASRHSLAVTGGIVSHTGVGGLVLGGGLGWLMGEMGLACDNLAELDVIDSALDLVHVDGDHADLPYFRGSGRGLGVVTSYRMQCHPIAESVTVGRVVLPLDATGDLWSEVASAQDSQPEWITFSPAIAYSGGAWRALLDFVATRPADVTRAYVAGVVPTALGGLTLFDAPYVDAQRILDTDLRFGRRNYWKSTAVDSLLPDLGSRLAEHAQAAPSTQTFVSVDVLHNAAQQEPVGGSTYTLRDKPFVVLFNTIWTDPGHDAANISWCRAGHDILQGSFEERSTYSNYFSHDDLGVQVGSHSSVPLPVRQRWVPAGLLG